MKFLKNETSAMKKIRLIFITICVLACTAAMASNKQGTSRVGEKADDVPCTCVFNSNRMWNPEKVLWNKDYLQYTGSHKEPRLEHFSFSGISENH